MKDPYALPSGVLRNRLGIDDADALAAAEADISGARMIGLAFRTVPGHYDLSHLRAFHRILFGDVFEWAGELRTVDITKSDTFCHWIHLESYAESVFDRVARARWLRGLDRPAFIGALAEFYAEINAIHPFREGNGRAQRAFLGQLAREASHPVSWAALDPQENETASIAGFRGDLRPLVAMLDGLVVRDQV